MDEDEQEAVVRRIITASLRVAAAERGGMDGEDTEAELSRAQDQLHSALDAFLDLSA